MKWALLNKNNYINPISNSIKNHINQITKKPISSSVIRITLLKKVHIKILIWVNQGVAGREKVKNLVVLLIIIKVKMTKEQITWLKK